ncbi:hypothetical protein V1264_007908 [Littorina saxatilis]|uniref:Uncharacterized protein n=2 Tax=Littorina saxatilis TaxID=31220 RepID=A0AAN9G492_9CAEN
MKVLLACFVLAVVVFAEDVFFYDTNGGDMVHRLKDECYVMALTQDQQANIHAHDFNLQMQQLMRDLGMSSNNTDPMNPDDASYFVAHHCHNRQLFSITQ